MMVKIFGPETSPHVSAWTRAFDAVGIPVSVESVSHVGRSRLLSILGSVLKSDRRGDAADVTVVQSLGTHGLLAILRGLEGRVVIVPWGSEVLRAVSPQPRWLIARKLLLAADVVIVTSHEMAREIESRWPGTASKTRTVSWGADLGVFRPLMDADELASRRQRWGFSEGDVVVVSARGAKPIYRPEVVRDAFIRASSARRHLRLVTAGYEERAARGQPDATPATRPRILRCGWLEKAELAELYSIADAAISIPKYDQRSGSVLEAAACGARLLLSDIPAYRELVQDGLECSILPQVDAATLTNALCSLQQRTHSERIAMRDWMMVHEDRDRQMRLIVEICLGTDGSGNGAQGP